MSTPPPPPTTSAFNPTFSVLGRSYNLHEVIRLIAIVGAYALLRPYLLKLSSKFQARDHERPIDNAGTEHNSPAATGGSQSSRLKLGDGEEESDGEDLGWGAAARRRKREEARRRRVLMEEEERRRREDESDEDIEEFLDRPE